MRKTGFFILLGIYSALPAAASDLKPLWEEYTAVLQKWVSPNGVDYTGLQKDRKSLQKAIEKLSRVPEEAYRRLEEKEKIAFWVNAYNALTLSSVIEAYPVEKKNLFGGGEPGGIRDIPGVWTRSRHLLLGKRYSLDDIEHRILRKEFVEPRIHLALNCASKGCPPLRAEAYTGEKLEEQLEDQARRFLSDPRNFQWDPEKKEVRVSKIFDWFGKDFTSRYGSPLELEKHGKKEAAVLHFAALYAPGGSPRLWLKRFQMVQLKFLDYDWSLNDASGS